MKSLKRIGWPAVFAIVVLLGVTGVARAAVEDDIPADAVGFIKVQDPVDQFDRLTGGALFQKLEDPAFVPPLAAGIEKARQGIAAFEAQQHLNVHQVLSDLLGREVALAALPNNEAVGIIEGRDAKSLQAALDEFLRIQRQSGDLTAESTSTYKGVTIYSGMQKQGERYHALVGNVLAVSSQPDAVQKVIDVLKGAPSLGATDACKRAASMTAKNAAITGFLNGAALQPLAQKLEAPGPKPNDVGAKLVRARLADFLRQVDYGVLGVSGDGALHVQLTFVYKNGRIPDALRAALPKPGSSLDILRLAPKSSVIVAARSLNVQGAWDSIVQAVAAVRPQGADKLKQGLDTAVGLIGGVYTPDQLFAELGGQVGVFVLPGAEGAAFPAGVVAIGLRDTTHIPDAVSTLVGVDAAVARSKAWDVTIDAPRYRGVQLSTVHINRPGPLAQLTPTFGVVDDYLVAASTLDAAKQVVDAAMSGSAPMQEPAGTPVATLSVSVPQVRALLAQYHGFLVKKAVADGKSQARAEMDLSALDKLLELGRKLSLTTTYQPGSTSHYLTIELATGR